jgi:hypothetical protein
MMTTGLDASQLLYHGESLCAKAPEGWGTPGRSRILGSATDANISAKSGDTSPHSKTLRAVHVALKRRANFTGPAPTVPPAAF